MTAKILIYRDYGCAPVEALERELRNYFVPRGFRVEFVDAAGIRAGALEEKDVAALWFSGGAAGAYRSKLGNEGEAAVRRYVEAGGIYAGICAGAYYACKDILFEEDIPQLKVYAQGLGLVKTTAEGTLKKNLRLLPFAVTEASAAVVQLEWADERKYWAHYLGGPWFKEQDDEAEVLARYNIVGKPAAILKKNIGKGLVLLSGVHYEDDYYDIERGLHKKRLDYAKAVKNCKALKDHAAARTRLAERIFQMAEEFYRG